MINRLLMGGWSEGGIFMGGFLPHMSEIGKVYFHDNCGQEHSQSAIEAFKQRNPLFRNVHVSFLQNPSCPSLALLAKQVTLQNIREPNLSKGVSKLPLPEMLKEYLL